MTDPHPLDDDGDDLTPDERLAFLAASWTTTTLACCPRCRQVRAYCVACGDLNAMEVPADVVLPAALPAALPGNCNNCGTPALITVVGWTKDHPRGHQLRTSRSQATSTEAAAVQTQLAAHLERCLQSGDGQRSGAPRAATPPRRPIPPALQCRILDRLRRGPAADHARHPIDRWREPLHGCGVVLPAAATVAASYRRLCGIGSLVAMPNRTPAVYSALEVIACCIELGIDLPDQFLQQRHQLLQLHQWLAAELRTVRGDT